MQRIMCSIPAEGKVSFCNFFGSLHFIEASICVIHICLYGCLCVHETAATLDGVAELPGTQTSQQTDVNECH